MYTFAQSLSHAPSGLYLLGGNWRSRRIDALCRLRRLRLFRIDCRLVRGKAGFLAAAARSMQFPEWFGNNWDAFADCATDLSWAPASGYVIVLGDVEQFARHSPNGFETALDILEEAAFYWSGLGLAFHILIASRSVGGSRTLPTVKAP